MKLEDLSSIKANPEPTSSTGRPRRPTFSRAAFSQLSFLDKRRPLDRYDPRAIEWRQVFRSWFLGTRWEDLKRENVLEWLAWSFYGMKLEDIVAEWEQEGRPGLPEEAPDADAILAADENPEETGGKLPFLYQGLFMLEARAGMPLPDGRAPGKSIRLHLDPVQSSSRPLAKYLVTGLFNVLLVKRTKSAGFQKVVDGGLEYLIRLPAGWKPSGDDNNPVMFIHGLGMGLAQYASLVSYFEKHPGLQHRPLILLLQPHISMNLFHPEHLKPPSKTSTTRGLRALVAKWGFEDGMTVVSHSNGTIVHGWLLKECPELIKRSCFVDPVTFCAFSVLDIVLHWLTDDVCRPVAAGYRLQLPVQAATDWHRGPHEVLCWFRTGHRTHAPAVFRLVGQHPLGRRDSRNRRLAQNRLLPFGEGRYSQCAPDRKVLEGSRRADRRDRR